jgi:hypothetical protein
MRVVLDTNILFSSQRPFRLCKSLLFGADDDLDIRHTHGHNDHIDYHYRD